MFLLNPKNMNAPTDTEEEIKIEYEDSPEKDPLAEDLEDTQQETEIGKATMQMPTMPIPNNLIQIADAVEIQEIEKKVNLPESDDKNEDLSNDDEHLDRNILIPDSGFDDNPEDDATWYKAINGSGKYICSFCDRTYSVLTSLRYHVTLKHPTEVIPLKNKILKKRRTSQSKCNICKKRFKTLDELKQHIKVHDIENVANSCRHCNAVFENTQELMRHSRTHDLLYKKLHICTTCGYRTGKLSHLKQHSLIHTLEKRNKCQHCDYTTNRKSNLKNHARIHVKDKLYKCDFGGCNSSFTDVAGLNCHALKHYPDDNMLFCDQCGYRTVYKQSLRVHVERHARR